MARVISAVSRPGSTPASARIICTSLLSASTSCSTKCASSTYGLPRSFAASAAALKARWQVGFSRATSSLRLKTCDDLPSAMAVLPLPHPG